MAATAMMLISAATATAQIKTAYFMEGSVQRYDLNAALTPSYGYLNFPLLPLGNFGTSFNNNFFAVNNLIYPHDGGHVTFLHGSVDAASFLRRVPRRASVNTSVNYNLVGFGKYNKKRDYFWSVNWNLRAEAGAGIPKDVFRILKDLRNGRYDIPDITIGGMAYSELALGVTMPTGLDGLTVGGRLKFLIGLGHAEARLTGISLISNESEATAEFTGAVNANILGMDYSRMPGDETGLSEIFNFGNYFDIGKGFRSYGAAIDLGAEMKLLDDRLKVSAAINDLGFIVWGRANSIQAGIEGLSYTFTGIDLDSGEAQIEENGDTKLSYRGSSRYTRRLAMTMNIGAEYNFFDNLLGVGLLSHSKFSDGVNYSELTLSCNVRPCGWFTTTLSHSLIHNRIGIFGFALNFHPKGINIFLGADYIPLSYASLDESLIGLTTWPLRAKSLNVTFGLAFTLGRARPW